MSENKEECINSVKYSRLVTENIQLRQTSLTNPILQNIDSYVNNSVKFIENIKYCPYYSIS